MRKKLRIIPGVLIFAMLLAVPLYFTCGLNPDGKTMYAHFINVGQGDATLLEFPAGAILIDTGAQDQAHVTRLISYLEDFFSGRGDLNDTLEAVFITHNHPDHIKGLREIFEDQDIDVERLIHNGRASASGRGDLCWALGNKATLGYTEEAVTYERVTANNNKNGLTNSNIDPIGGTECDPVIKILSGGFTDRPEEWNLAEFDNKNNHSLVIRVDFGQASFLFTGDLEDAGIEKIVEYYRPASENDPNMLDIDVYQVGHHGSHNATTADLLMATTPEIAIIPVGKWDFGRDGNNRFTTYWYGHPRKAIIDLLAISIPDKRSSPPDAMIAEGSRNFVEQKIRKKIYATAWDGTIKVKAKDEGSYWVYRNR